MYATGHLDVVAIRHNLSCRSMSPNHGETMRCRLRDCRADAVMTVARDDSGVCGGRSRHSVRADDSRSPDERSDIRVLTRCRGEPRYRCADPAYGRCQLARRRPTSERDASVSSVIASQRVRADARPDDRLREAIQSLSGTRFWIASLRSQWRCG